MGAVGGMHINIAVSYGGRHEPRDAFRSPPTERATQGRILEEVVATVKVDEISEYLYAKDQPDLDPVIHTSEKQQLSGFLLWQSAHSGLYFCEALWSDFHKVGLAHALCNYIQWGRHSGR